MTARLTTICKHAERAFSSHINDETVEVFDYGDLIEIDGGVWTIGITMAHEMWVSVPHNDPNYMDDDPRVFMENVFGTECVESLAVWNRRCQGFIVEKMRESGESWSNALADMIEEVTL